MNPTTDAQQVHSQQFVVVHFVPRDAYEQVLGALGEAHVRPATEPDAMELPRVIRGVPPRAYREFIDALPEHYLRHTYDGETLEIMTPLREHEGAKKLMGRMLEAMVLALDIPILSSGSTTLRTALADKGLEPDESYYIANEPRVRGSNVYRPGEDPPPDLAIEVDVTSAVLKRLPIYARLGVPELWRYVDDEVRFYRLSEGGEYMPTERSLAFPWMNSADVTRHLERRHDMDEN